MNFSMLLKKHCYAALQAAFPDKRELLEPSLIEITEATQEKFGHYQCNSAMKLAKILGENPRQIAEKLVAKLQDPDFAAAALFETLSIAGPGFINFTLHKSYLSKILNEQLQDPRLGVPLPNEPLKVIIDYSSPNVAKEMHVGHLRTTIIGDCLARLMRFLGHRVLCLNHIGDWGTQFGMLIAYLKAEHPELAQPKENTSTLPSIELSDLVAWYRASKLRFDEDPAFKKQAQQEVVALQSGDITATRIWEHICEISRVNYQKIYDLLDIQLIERGESFYHPFLAPLLRDLAQKGLLTVSDGAQCMYLEGYTNREGEPLPLILQKSDGGYNYATTDLAALKHRVEEEKGQWLIYVIDAGQSTHLEMVFTAAKKADYYDPTKVRIDHVAFGFVLKPDGKKFKTRSGDTEKLIDLLEGAIQKAKEKLLERDPDITPLDLEKSAHVLGLNAVKYADLSCHRMSDYIFSYDKMLKFEGNTAAFLLYAYVRIQSIQRKIGAQTFKLSKDNPENFKIELKEPSEIALGLLVAQFSEVLDHMSHTLMPHQLTDYLYRLAEKFHVFFHQCRVEGSPEQNSRLLLCEVTARVLNQGMQILGLKPLERM